MFRITIILILGFQTIGLGQTLTGQVFMLAESFDAAKCEVYANCDCCASDLYFLSGNKFCFVNRCLSGDSYYTGRYSISSGKLKLSFNKKYVSEITDEDYNVIKLQNKIGEPDTFEFDIVGCGNKFRLTHATFREWKNGGRYEANKELELMKELRSSKAFKQLLE